ncbi:(deoxy)nucleoside triphosphate pyrophosphohydrolase [Marinicella rhabdoformis]|uniref:(deoxy)nucleoside triphosphate pyrophosphohydrolase n=1 Tax=Marinicella rhabdoformis TaxID=2580566 RepID=UPI0012AEBADF|nr:(deoxy)nucleoside triphosphate pyrophosphohydrolase [Marinicella rhabdoformis]
MSRQTDIKRISVVALVLENHQGNILIQQRNQHTHLGGLWEFPGGKVEVNESHKQALIREIQEELSYTPQNPKHLITVSHQYPEKAIELIVFYEQSSNPVVSAAENQPLKWVPKAELSNFPMPEADLPIINLINRQP